LGLEPGRNSKLPLGLPKHGEVKRGTTKTKKEWRSATGRDSVTAIRLSEKFCMDIDNWAANQDDKPPRSEAIRRLVEMSLKSDSAQKPVRSVARTLRAHELAAEAIDKMAHPTAHP
jgi:hypothetical protein